MDGYISTKTFIENQIRLLNSGFDINDDDIDQVIAYKRGDIHNHELEDTITEDSINDKPKKISISAFNKVLIKVNQRQKEYYTRLFTQQATRHVAQQVQSAKATKILKAQEALRGQQASNLIPSDPQLSAIISSSSFSSASINGMSNGEIISFAQLLVEAADYTGSDSGKGQKNNHPYQHSIRRLKLVIEQYNTAINKNRQIKDRLEMVQRIFGRDGNAIEALVKNVPTNDAGSPSLSQELLRLQNLTEKLNNKSKNELKRGLQGLSEEDFEADDMNDNEQLLKRQKFIISNQLDI